MRKVFIVCITLITSVFILTACGSNDKTPEESKKNSKEESKESNENDKDVDKSTESSEKQENQLDLVIGDTGKFSTVLGDYDMTLHSAELVDGEIEGEKSTRDGFIVLDLTIKNTSNETQDIADFIMGMEVAQNLDHSGSTDHADGFETFEAFEGEIEPGEEKSGQFLTIVDNSEEHFFRRLVGNIASGSSNQVIWTIPEDEAR